MTLSKLTCLTHCNSPLAHKSTLFLQKHGSEKIVEIGLSLSFTGRQKVDGACALPQEAASSPCSADRSLA